jgi:hypothetical protein
LQQHLLTRRITLHVVTWEELLRLLDSSNFLVTEFVLFIKERFLVHVEFTAQEVQRIMSTEIPELLQKIFTLVNRVKGEIEGNGIEAGRSTQSVRYWGFNLFKNGRCFYFGYMFNHWIKYETPLFLHVTPRWEGNENLEEEHLIQSGMLKESEGEFLLPVTLQAGDETAALGVIVGQLQPVIDRVASLEAATAAAEPPTPAQQPGGEQPTT